MQTIIVKKVPVIALLRELIAFWHAITIVVFQVQKVHMDS